MTATLAPELLTRLEHLATARHIGTDALIADAIRVYLAREEAKSRPRPEPTRDLDAIHECRRLRR